jgi:hypothetical protein
MAIAIANTSFAMRGIRVDEIERKEDGGERIAGNSSNMVFGGEKDNPTWIDRDKDG